MGLEAAPFIDSLNSSWPLNSDQVLQGDDHIRLIKAAIKASFTGVAGAVTLTHTQLNAAAIKSASNIFTSPGDAIILNSSSPAIRQIHTGAAADEGSWRMLLGVDTWQLTTRTDAEVLGEQPIVITRNGTAVTNFALNADAIALNGNADVSGAMEIGTAIELGHASDTSLTRIAAGILGVEGRVALLHNDTGYDSAKVTVSTSGPSGGANGDIWLEV